MASKSWGSFPSVKSRTPVSTSTEIPRGTSVYLDSGRKDIQGMMPWDVQNLLGGDMTLMRNQIEAQIPGSQVQYLNISWDALTYSPILLSYFFLGFRVEAVVKNVNAGLTGLEIVAIIGAVTFMVAVFALVGTFVWSALQLIMSFGGGGALIVFLVAGAGILLLLGTQISVGGGKGFRMGKNLDKG